MNFNKNKQKMGRIFFFSDSFYNTRKSFRLFLGVDNETLKHHLFAVFERAGVCYCDSPIEVCCFLIMEKTEVRTVVKYFY